MRKLLAVSLLGVLICVSISNADLVTPRAREEKISAPPQGSRVFLDTFKANEDAVVIASGKGQTVMALYVYDAAGNCVAKHDVTHPATADDMIVRWVPAEQARYLVEVRNAGHEVNSFRIAIR